MTWKLNCLCYYDMTLTALSEYHIVFGLFSNIQTLFVKQKNRDKKHDLPDVSGQSLNHLLSSIPGKFTQKKLSTISAEWTIPSLTAYTFP